MVRQAKVSEWLKRFDRFLTGTTEEGAEGTTEHRAYCPLHENPETSKTPSASLNPDKGTFMCFSRCGGYSLAKVWDLTKDDEPGSNVRSIGSAPSARKKAKKKPVRSAKLPDDVQLKKWHLRLMKSSMALGNFQTKRGLDKTTLETFTIGYDGDRYTIPIRDEDGLLVNVRRYKLGVNHNKMMNIPGAGDATLFLPDALAGEWLVLCEGELDALIARQYGFPACSTTAGAGTWPAEWTKRFKDKRVYIVYDVDDQGTQGAKKVAVRLAKAGAEVFVVKLPLTQKGADVTDYFVAQGYGKSDFQRLLDEATPFQSRAVSGRAKRAKAVPVTLEGTMDSALTDHPIEVIATIAGKVQPPYALPRRMVLTCTQDWSKDRCNKCSMDMFHGGQYTKEIPADDKLLLRLVDKSEAQQRIEILKEIQAPHTCPVIEMEPEQNWAVEQLILTPNVDDADANRNVTREAYNVGPHATPVNTTVKLVGVNTSDPRNSRMVLQTWECAETRTSLDNFLMTPELLEDLSVFQPSPGEHPADKLWSIAEDLGANVTRIYGRPEMHIAYDLVWHSLLDFRFRRSQLGKGWLELLVIGDTRTGKSEAAMRLTRHYQSGVMTSCEGATLAGLVGGAQQVNNNWTITWGTIPLQDRRLVVLDEVSGLKDKGVLENMSEVRSSGIAKVTKIVSQQTNARTRLIWISNPVDKRSIQEMPRGAIDAIVDLIPAPEDIARFDMAMVAAKADVASSIINAARPPKVEHRYTSELCSKLVLWAWSRGPRDVVWERGAERLVLRLAEEIGSRYVADPPLLQAENARVKLARISVAIAARLFSHDGTGNKVYVTHEHVRTARRFLDKLYRQPQFGYADHSRKEIRAREKAEEGRKACWTYLRKNPHVLEALVSVVNDKEFRARDFCEFGGLSQDEANLAVGMLLRMQMVRRHTRGYIRMQPELIALVRRLEERNSRPTT